MALSKGFFDDIGPSLDKVLAHFDADLEGLLGDNLTTTYVSGTAEMTSWGHTKAGIPISYEGPPVQQAIDFARERGAKLVTQMDEETKRRLANVISKGIENKRGIPGIQRDLRSTFTDMSRHRSELIARTETANALSTASLDSMKDMGIEGKEWVTAGDDRVSEECQGNEAEGVIPVNQSFSGGVLAPPQHPDCRCTVAPAILKKKPAEPTKPTSEEWAKGLDSDEKRVMDYWQGSGYEKIRNIQQTGKGPTNIKSAIKDLNKALDKAPTYDGQVYRGLNNLDAKTFNLLKNSKELKWDALSSGAKTEKAAARFLRGTKGDNIMFRIQNKTGVDLTAIYKQEAEVLMRKGARFRVVGQSEKAYTVGKDTFKSLEMVLKEI